MSSPFSPRRPGKFDALVSLGTVTPTCHPSSQHCERHIQSLQTRVLELQQQLAVAVTADRKKDVMIEQLDKVPGEQNAGGALHGGKSKRGGRPAFLCSLWELGPGVDFPILGEGGC